MNSPRYRRVLAGPAALFALALIVFSVLFMTTGSAHGQGSLVSSNPQDIAAGEILYEAHCQSCHGYQGQGGVVQGAPALVNVGAAAADFYLTTGRMPLNNPGNEAIRHHPAFSATEIRQLVAYVNALPVITGTNQFGPTIPTIMPLCANQTVPTTTSTTTGLGGGSNSGGGSGSNCVTLSQGQALFAINCAQCHQAAGSGGMLSKGNVVPSLHNANMTQVAEAMRVGPKPMPVFASSDFSDAQVSAIAHYVDYLHKPADPGGLGISHFGPVAEGFVGILLGFVVLWFAARMIGNRG